MKPKRSHKQERLAKIYDAEILPIWSERFGRLLLRKLSLPQKAMVLDVGTGTGYPALEVLRRMDDHGRIISIDPASSMLDVAREKAGPLGGKRIFFRSESAEPKLSFTDQVFDLVISNLTLQDFDRPSSAVADFARVTKPGGRVIVTLPLAGTFDEFYDLFREVLVQLDRADALERLDRHLGKMPAPDDARRWFERAGLTDVEVEYEDFTLLFRSSREFFFAPLIEYGPLSTWKEIAGKGAEMQEVFWRVKEAIDAYFGHGSFSVTVRAACVSGRSLLDEERAAAAAVIEPGSDGPTSENELYEQHKPRGDERVDESVERPAPDGDDYEDDDGPEEEVLSETAVRIPMPKDGGRR